MINLVKKALVGTVLIGSVFGVNANSLSLTKIYSFAGGGVAGNGAWPVGQLVVGQDGNFYGVTYGGVGMAVETGEYGVFYKISPSGVETDLYDFGTTDNDASTPRGGLMLSSDGSFYGTGSLGGKYNLGAIYKITIVNDVLTEKVIYSFSGNSNNAPIPDAALIEANGYLFGTTKYGGQYNSGSVFTVDKNGHNFSTMYSFKPKDGSPNTKLTLASNGDIYGVSQGSGSGNGIIYKLQPVFISGKLTYVFKIIHSFTSQNGTNPEGSLVYNNNILYGTTSEGGANDCGTLYNLTNDVFAKIYDFDGCGEGFYARGSLLIEHDTIYGVSPLGGAYGYGSVYSYNLNTHKFSTIHSFNSLSNKFYNQGEHPMSGLIDLDGILYGSAYKGGTLGQDAGTIFKITKNN